MNMKFKMSIDDEKEFIHIDTIWTKAFRYGVDFEKAKKYVRGLGMHIEH